MRRAAGAAMLLLALALTGCASGAAPGATALPSGPLRTPLPATEPSGAPVTLAVHRGGTPGKPGPLWSKASGTGSAVTVQWAGAASDACGAVDGVWVTETATAVVIALGAHAVAAGHICPMVLVPHTAVVTLAAPLGARRLLEPARTACGAGVTEDSGAGRPCPVRPAP